MITTAKLFQPGMVVQRDKPLHIWGTAPAGAQLSLSIQRVNATAQADENGAWRAQLPALSASESETLTIETAQETLQLSDIAVGEVWVAAGQSNMEFWMRYERHMALQAHYSNRRLRFYDVPKLSYEGQERTFDFSQVGRWRTAERQSDLEWFSAPGFYFAKELEAKLDVPVGIIGCNWGGTSICSWMSTASLEQTAPGWAAARRSPFEGLDWADFLAECAKNPANDTGRPFQNPFIELMLPRTPDEAEIRAAFPEPDPFAHLPLPQSLPGVLYERMVKTIAPFPVRGVLWYQGESDDEFPPRSLYRDALGAMMRDWRALWQDSRMPFLVVQIPGYESWNGFHSTDLPTIRQAQQECTDLDRHAFLCSITDAGERYDIHPKDKKVVGERLALLALGHVYGWKVLCDAPRLIRITRRGREIALHFANAEGGLVIRGGALADLTVTEDASPVPFTARTERSQLLLTLGRDAGALRLDFARGAWFLVNLYNRSGIPALPFTAACPAEDGRTAV